MTLPSTSWRSQNEAAANSIAQAYATQLLIWETVIGERDANFNHVKYNGMTAEKAIYAWIKSEFLMPKKLVFHSTNVYYELMKPSIEQKQKEVLKLND